jgi:predicted ester cyclase
VERSSYEEITMDVKVVGNRVEIVRSFIETWNKHDVNATMGYLDPNAAFQSPLFRVQGVQARTEVNEGFMTSMPDFRYKLIRITGDSELVAAELLGAGTSTGPAKVPGRDPIPPTGRHVEFAMAGFFRLTAEGKIVEERYYYDRLDLMQQLNPPSQA